MPHDFQITVDSADPHRLADWWADALGWVVEASDEGFIQRMVVEGQAREEDTARHRGVLVWRDGAAIVHPDGPRVGPGHRILFQRVPEAKTVKNRVHLDLRVGPERVDEEVTRLTAAGATLLHHGQQGPYAWVTMADPEGNELCIG